MPCYNKNIYNIGLIQNFILNNDFFIMQVTCELSLIIWSRKENIAIYLKIACHIY